MKQTLADVEEAEEDTAVVDAEGVDKAVAADVARCEHALTVA